MKRHARGFSLIELMVGVVLAIVVLIIITQTLAAFESQRRATTGGSDSAVNGSIALFQVERDARMAAFGFTSPTGMLCPLGINIYYNGTTVLERGSAGADPDHRRRIRRRRSTPLRPQLLRLRHRPVDPGRGDGRPRRDRHHRQRARHRVGRSLPRRRGGRHESLHADAGERERRRRREPAGTFRTRRRCCSTRRIRPRRSRPRRRTSSAIRQSRWARSASGTTACCATTIWRHRPPTAATSSSTTRSRPAPRSTGRTPTSITSRRRSSTCRRSTASRRQERDAVSQWVDATGAWAAPISSANMLRIKAMRVALVARVVEVRNDDGQPRVARALGQGSDVAKDDHARTMPSDTIATRSSTS